MTDNTFTITGVAAPYHQRNIDTDQILPARFLHRLRSEGFGDTLFRDLRLDENDVPRDDFVLNDPAYASASILVAGPNYGCGSSREHAVWAMVDHGFKAVIAPSFGEIFFNNALQNGFLALVLPESDIQAILAEITGAPGTQISLNIDNQVLVAGGVELPFEIGAYQRDVVKTGLSEVEVTLSEIDKVLSYERDHTRRFPWLAAPEAPAGFA
jgi:3-isopropylmalate/(R)-2-methylmalate dehydratase small subunit